MRALVKRIPAFLLALIVLSSCFGCTEQTPQTDGGFYIYYKSASKKELYPVEAVLDGSLAFDTRLASVWRHFITGNDPSTYVSPVPSALTLRNYSLLEKNLILNFDQSYKSIPVSDEVLFRAALVKTLTQFPEVSTIEIQVDSQPLTLSDGSLVGPMKSGDFIDVFGTGLNAYSEVTMNLFFTDEFSTGLIQEQTRIMYNNSIPLEQAVLLRLISGPEYSDRYPTLSSDVKLLSVTSNNGVCYVNLSDAFLNDPVVFKPEIAVYSIVNSLTEIKGISSVILSVNGSSAVQFMDQLDLSVPFYRNNGIVLNASENASQETQ